MPLRPDNNIDDEVDVDDNSSSGSCRRRLLIVRSFLPAILSLTAIIIGTAANFYCQTVQFVPDTAATDSLTLYASPWSYMTAGGGSDWQDDDNSFTTTTCRYYSYLEEDSVGGFQYTVDGTTKAVRAFSIMTPVVGALLVVGTCLGPCSTSSSSYFGRPGRWRTIGILLVVTAVLQGLTLLVTRSSICTDNPAVQFLDAIAYSSPSSGTFPGQCDPSAGYGLNVAAVVCWVLAGVFAIVFPPPAGGVVPAAHPPQEQTVTYVQNPVDGTVQEAHVTVVRGRPVAAASSSGPDKE
jgi:hypothetical protein